MKGSQYGSDAEPYHKPPAPSVHEPDERKPLLYDHRGKPLGRDHRVGFRPPQTRRT